MDNFKMKMLLLLLIALLISCGEKTDQMVSQSKYDEIVGQYNSLKEEHETSKRMNAERVNLINGICSNLNELSGRTYKLQTDLERNATSGSRDMAIQIKEDLDVIKKRLNNVPTTKDDKELKSIVNALRETISQKEKEIARMMKVIEEKEKENQNLRGQVHEFRSELGKANETISKNECNMWLNMGREILAAADLIEDKKGHGNMKSIKKAKLRILQKAIECFRNAKELGASEADELIADAEFKYNRLKNL